MLKYIKNVYQALIKPLIVLLASLLILIPFSIFFFVLDINFHLKSIVIGALFVLTSWMLYHALTKKSKANQIIYAGHITLLSIFFILCLVALSRHKPATICDNGKAMVVVVKNLLTDKTAIKNFPSKKDLLLTFFRLNLNFLLNKKNVVPVTQNIFGFNMTAASSKHIPFLFREIFIDKDYYLPLKNNSPLIIDCGCYQGFSLLFFKMLYPNSKILGFEAHPKNFQILEKNVNNNKFSNVKIINKAVYDSKETLSFSLESSLGSKIEEKNSNNVIHVEAVLLSDYINKPVDLLKMDIEGAETNVIKELSKNNKLHLIKNIIMEFHYDDSNKNSLAQILTILESSGFSYQVNKGSKVAGHAMLYAYQTKA